MTPSDIAMSIKDIQAPVVPGSLGTSVTYSYSWTGGAQNMDDANTWD